MKSVENNQKIVKGLFWKFSERFSAQIVSFIVSILLARLLLPSDYGIVSLVLVFIDLANVFVVNGFSTALIQNKNSDEVDFSTMFFSSLFISLLFYFIIFCSAGFIANFYDNLLIIPVVRVLALRIPLSAINSIQHAYVSRKMQFKKFFFSTIIGTIFSGVVGIVMALKGYGVWALVAQYLVNSIVDTIVLFFTIGWKPKFLFSYKRAKIMMNYGWKITLGAFVDELYIQVRALIIGKKYNSESLAFYNKGNQFPKLFITNINSSISSVLFPGMSNLSDNKAEVKQLCQKFIKNVSFLISPLMIGLYVVSPALISILLTEAWMPCLPFLRIACINYMLTPINSANLQAIKALGRSDVFLKLEITKKVLGIIILLISMWFGIYVLALSALFVQILCNILNAIPTKKLLGYGYLDQMRDIIPSIGMSIIMGLIICLLEFFNLNNILLLILQVLLGIIIYFALSFCLKNESLYTIINLIRNFMSKRRGT